MSDVKERQNECFNMKKPFFSISVRMYKKNNGRNTSLCLFTQMFPFDPPESIRKPNVFWCLQTKCFLMFARESKGNIAKKRVKRHGVIINYGINCSEVLINLFVTNVLILYSQKTLENLLFSDVFKGGIKWEH